MDRSVARELTDLTIADMCALCGAESPQVSLLGLSPGKTPADFNKRARTLMAEKLAKLGWLFTAKGTFCPEHAAAAGTGGGRA